MQISLGTDEVERIVYDYLTEKLGYSVLGGTENFDSENKFDRPVWFDEREETHDCTFNAFVCLPDQIDKEQDGEQ